MKSPILEVFGKATQAKLPKSLENTNLISNMRVGQIGYTVPWAMFVDAERNCWLSEHYEFSYEPGGTADMLVERTKDGFRVKTAHGSDYRWTPSAGGSESNSIPVIKVS